MFSYDFETISKKNYMIDPNVFPQLDSPKEFRFFHDKNQQQHISNQVNIYSHSSVGLGKLIQRSNLKLIFRSFEKNGLIQQSTDA